MHQSELRIAVSNTGPLVSAFQCGRLDVMRQIYDVIHIPANVLVELVIHGAEPEIAELVRVGFVVVHNDLTEEERVIAQAIAETIADSSKSHSKNPAHHLSEAEAIALMSRKELAAIELLFVLVNDIMKFSIAKSGWRTHWARGRQWAGPGGGAHCTRPGIGPGEPPVPGHLARTCLATTL